MRNLTSIESATDVLTDFSFEILASDQSTTYVFSQSNLVDAPVISWDIDFLGGIGKTSNYNVTLSSSLSFIKDILPTLTNAKVKFNVTVNSDTYQPHSGRIKTFKRLASDPNKLNITVYDEFLNTNPKYPIETIQQSFSTLHPDILNDDWGYPTYFGKHTRPFYHTPVSCRMTEFLGPRQVSSENHVNSVFFNDRMNEGDNVSQKNNVMLETFWQQESDSENFVTSTLEFIKDIQTLDTRIFKFSDRLKDNGVPPGISIVGSVGAALDIRNGYSSGITDLDTIDDPQTSISHTARYELFVTPAMQSKLLRMYRIEGSVNFSNTNSLNPLFLRLEAQDSASQAASTDIFDDSPNATYNILTPTGGNFNNFGTLGNFGSLKSSIGFLAEVDPNDKVTCTFSMTFTALLSSEAFKGYSIFSPQVNCSDIGITENPIGIAQEVLDQSSVNFLQEQSSDSQLSTDNFNLQCFFGKRRDLSKIVDELGKISGTYLWIGDSGSMNFRTYTNSEDVALDATITTSDILNIDIIENPLGTTKFNSKKSSQIKLEYDFDYQLNKYKQSLLAHPNNNSLCATAAENGIQGFSTIRTEYILETATAELYHNFLIKKQTQSEEFIELTLPGRFLSLELADVIKIQHPIIVGSESLYQVISVKNDFNSRSGGGNVKITAEELLDV